MTVENKECGVLMFMRGDSGMGKERYRIYRDEVLIPFIKQSRKYFGRWKEGMPIPKYMMTVSWCDGNLAD